MTRSSSPQPTPVHTLAPLADSPGSAEAERSVAWLFAVRSPAVRLSLGVFLALAALLFTVQFSWALDRNIFMLLFVATTITALLAGWIPGLLSIAIGAAGFAVMLSQPIGSPFIASPTDRGRVAAFAIVAAIVVALCESLRRTSARVEQRELELRAGLTMLRTLVNATPLAVITLDIDRRVQLWNPAAQRLFGWRASEVIGQRYPLVPAPLEADHVELMTRMHREGHAFSGMHTRHLRKDGTEADVTLWLAPLHDGTGRIVGSLRIAADATEQLALEARLREAQKLEAVGGLAGGVAHDFNNMLTAILSSAELAMQELPDAHVVRDDLREIRQAALRAADLTRQLLAFGRRQIMQPQTLQLGPLIAEMTPSLQRIVGPTITLLVELEPGLPASHVDRAQLEEVMQSLSENARESMPAGGELRIAARRWSTSASPLRGCPAVAEGDYVLVTVADNGCGMTERTLSHLFEPFFTTKPFGRSAGLGLATVYGIVRQSNGYVWATSTPGAGSEFHVLLPVSGAESEPSIVRGGRHRPTVLLVDDEETVRTISARLLERAGYRVLASAGGEEALLKADEMERPADLLVTDLLMPRMSGTQLARLLRERWPSLEVIYLSGLTESDAASHGLQKGEAHFLSKPFEIGVLLELVARVLGDARAAA